MVSRRSFLRPAIQVLLAVLVLLLPGPAHALDRVAVELRERFPEASVVSSSLAAADDGGLWFATEGGLYRYDGARYVRIAASELPAAELVVKYGQGVAVTGHGRRIAVVEEDSVRWLDPPAPGPLRSIAADDSALWVLVGQTLLRHDGTWQTIDIPGPLARLSTDAYGVLAVGPQQVWAVSSSEVESIADGFSSATFAARTADALYVQEFLHHTWRVRAPLDRQLVLDVPARNVGLVEQHGAMWAVTTNHVARLDEHGAVVTETPAGPPQFDREGTLWLATFSGPIALPAPDTTIFTVDDGLPTDAAIAASTIGDTVWATTWNGLARYDAQRRRFVAYPTQPALIYAPPCEDGEGRAWGVTSGGWKQHFIVDLQSGSRTPSREGHRCTSEGGWAWIDQGDHLLALRGDVRRKAQLPDPDPVLLAGGGGRLWAGYVDGQLCSALADPTDELQWSCERAAADHHLTALWVAPSGHVWLGTRHGGVWRRTTTGWTSLDAALPIPNVRAMSASPRGGVWISGSGRAVRVEEDDDGWRIKETLRSWHGIRRGTAGAVLDTPSGDLWIGSERGLVHVPATVRDGVVAPPLPAWEQRLGGAHAATTIVRSAGDSHLAIEFTAHALRDPFAARYRFRLRADEPWSEPQAEPRLILAGMAAGRYEIAVQAKVPGSDWVMADDPVRVVVLPPWYATWWFRVVLGAIAAAVVFAFYRARVSAALEMYEQRARIAADLHDQVGSTLSAIRLTASSAAAVSLPAERTRPVFAGIAETSGELGVRLRDIVWCLRAESSNLGALASFLERRARQLLPEAVVEVEVQCPSVVPLSLPVLRCVQLVGLEALHNACKHAEARRVQLSILPDGSRWRMVVEDDGHGRVVASDGLGLTSMKTRADAIGADFELEGVRGRGTRVSLTFEANRA